MNMTRRGFVGLGAAATALLAACGSDKTEEPTTQETAASKETTGVSTSLALDSAAWSYDVEDDVYYQLGIPYCETPADEGYERLAILVPGAYFGATDNGDGTYTCEVDADGKVGTYTAATAPIVMPVNTPGYSAQSAMAEYSSKGEYTSQGIVYVHAGCRGRDHGAPAGVTDLKAAVRFLRAFSSQIPGDAERIFTFGHSGGGAQSALMGATGDAPEYDTYLDAIGAVQGVSDAVYGSMDWCPISNLDTADAAYEWMMGCTRSGLSDDEQAISDALAEAYAGYVNAAQIPGEGGSALALEQSSEGVWQAGTYYDRVKAAIEESLNNFLADTSFPYDGSSSMGMGGGPSGGGAPSGDRPGGAPSGEPPAGTHRQAPLAAARREVPAPPTLRTASPAPPPPEGSAPTARTRRRPTTSTPSTPTASGSPTTSPPTPRPSRVSGRSAWRSSRRARAWVPSTSSIAARARTRSSERAERRATSTPCSPRFSMTSAATTPTTWPSRTASARTPEPAWPCTPHSTTFSPARAATGSPSRPGTGASAPASPRATRRSPASSTSRWPRRHTPRSIPSTSRPSGARATPRPNAAGARPTTSSAG